MGGMVLIAAVATVGALLQTSRAFERVRTDTPQLARLTIETHQQSATFRRIIATLEASDVVVYLAFGRCSTSAKACLRFVSRPDHNRYVLVKLDQFLSTPHELPGLLAHELQHATEVSRAPAVVDNLSFLTFLTGNQPSSPRDREVRAQQVANQVNREVLAGRR